MKLRYATVTGVARDDLPMPGRKPASRQGGRRHGIASFPGEAGPVRSPCFKEDEV